MGRDVKNMPWRKIIFMDVDGTVNSDKWYEKRKGKVLQGDFDPDTVKLINQFKDIGAEVVISSSWGDMAIKPLQDVGLELPIIGCTERFHSSWACRGNEIERWLLENFGGMGTKYGKNRQTGQPWYREHSSEKDIDYEFVIFDDDADFLLGQVNNFVRVDPRVGITQEDVDKARYILERRDLTASD